MLWHSSSILGQWFCGMDVVHNMKIYRRGVAALLYMQLLALGCVVVVPSAAAFTAAANGTWRRSRRHDDVAVLREELTRPRPTLPPGPPSYFLRSETALQLHHRPHGQQQQQLTQQWELPSPPLAAAAAKTTTNDPSSRRHVLIHAAAAASVGILSTTMIPSGIAFAADSDSGGAVAPVDDETPPIPPRPSTATAVVTDTIYVDISSPTSSPTTAASDRLVIGLFGRAAPLSVAKLRQLVSPSGLPAPCRPRAQRSLQKEQLESNVLYYRCMDGEAEGVTLRYGTVWRIRKDEGIDVGAVTGKFVAREYPTYTEEENDEENSSYIAYSHDAAGLVSVRRGNESGFGFTISPVANPAMDEDYIVVGRVLDDDSMAVVAKLNEIPVVNSAPVVNYMALTGGPKTSNAPDRSCRYGGPMYCNENKPLIKLKISDCGVLKMK